MPVSFSSSPHRRERRAKTPAPLSAP
uniref:Uncharacterized protein n=1 Tax=Arundo donax TaxID=35708 RepID=A0A0A8ZL22_ARUDO